MELRKTSKLDINGIRLCDCPEDPGDRIDEKLSYAVSYTFRLTDPPERKRVPCMEFRLHCTPELAKACGGSEHDANRYVFRYGISYKPHDGYFPDKSISVDNYGNKMTLDLTSDEQVAILDRIKDCCREQYGVEFEDIAQAALYYQNLKHDTYSLYILNDKDGSGEWSYDVTEFDATDRPEEMIASALYKGYKESAPSKPVNDLDDRPRAFVTKYYADGYSHYDVNARGLFRTSVIDYSCVNQFDHDMIRDLYNNFRSGRKEPSEITNPYDFLDEHTDASDKGVLTCIDTSVLTFDKDSQIDFAEGINSRTIPATPFERVITRALYPSRLAAGRKISAEYLPELPGVLKPKDFEIEHENGIYTFTGTINNERVYCTFSDSGLDSPDITDIEGAAILAEAYMENKFLGMYERHRIEQAVGDGAKSEDEAEL